MPTITGYRLPGFWGHMLLVLRQLRHVIGESVGDAEGRGCGVEGGDRVGHWL
jgi:hypothetical protein